MRFLDDQRHVNGYAHLFDKRASQPKICTDCFLKACIDQECNLRNLIIILWIEDGAHFNINDLHVVSPQDRLRPLNEIQPQSGINATTHERANNLIIACMILTHPIRRR